MEKEPFAKEFSSWGWKSQETDSALEPPEGVHPANTLISDEWHLETDVRLQTFVFLSHQVSDDLLQAPQEMNMPPNLEVSTWKLCPVVQLPQKKPPPLREANRDRYPLKTVTSVATCYQLSLCVKKIRPFIRALQP